MLLEVKDLGKANAKGEKQLFEYCFHQGVPIALLTDGREWSFFFPAGEGSYKDRRFAHIDLVNDDTNESAQTLRRYLWMSAVKSGEARQRAQEDYKTLRRQLEAATKYPAVWRKLVSEPHPSLLGLFREQVEAAAGVRPERERATDFIRGQRGAGAAKTTPSSTPKPAPAPAPALGDPWVKIGSNIETHKTASKVFGAVFRHLASEDPAFCRRYSEKHSGRKRPYVARSRQLLYPGMPKLQGHAVPLPGGWWLGTNVSNADKLQRIRWACEVAGLKFGHDIKVHLPTKSR